MLLTLPMVLYDIVFYWSCWLEQLAAAERYGAKLAGAEAVAADAEAREALAGAAADAARAMGRRAVDAMKVVAHSRLFW